MRCLGTVAFITALLVAVANAVLVSIYWDDSMFESVMAVSVRQKGLPEVFAEIKGVSPERYAEVEVDDFNAILEVYTQMVKEGGLIHPIVDYMRFNPSEGVYVISIMGGDYPKRKTNERKGTDLEKGDLSTN
jgi:hypothetical protein